MKPDRNTGVRIFVMLKTPGSLTKKVKEHSFVLGSTPHTLRDLIAESVRSCLAAYRARAARGKNPQPLTDEQFDGMREVGKFAFGFHYNEKEPDEAEAIRTAWEAVEDGLVRVFRGNEELTDPDAVLTVNEGDVFTFVRLTMLSGRMW